MNNLILNKITKETAKKLGVSRKDAVVVLALDDFWDTLKDKGLKYLNKAKDFVRDNKHMVYPMVSSLLGQYMPAVKTIFD